MEGKEGLKIYFDNFRKAPEGWIKVNNYRKAIEYLQNYYVAEISLDYDLGPRKQKTGFDVLVWIEENIIDLEIEPPTIHIHTTDLDIKEEMEEVLERMMSKSKK